MPYDGYIFRLPEPPTKWQFWKRKLFCTPPTHEDARDILILARSLITPEENWCQKNFAEYKPFGRAAYCAQGALHVASWRLGWKDIPPAVDTILDELAAEKGFLTIVDLNDETDHMTVLEVLTTAIIALNDGLSS